MHALAKKSGGVLGQLFRRFMCEADRREQENRLPPRYDDEITEDTIKKLNAIVPDDDFRDFKATSDPAW